MSFPTIPGAGGLPKVVLSSRDGARAEIYLHGAHLTSWIPAGSSGDRLFLSARSRFSEGAAIRGGIPVSFPQFAAQGPLPNHGFARVTRWDLTRAAVDDDGSASAFLRLTDSDATRRLWPHAFALVLDVRLSGASLEIGFGVVNAGAARFEFTAALHTYLAVADVAQTSVHGLHGAAYIDKVRGDPDCREANAVLRIDGAIDRVYRAAPPDLEVREPSRAIGVRATGFPDTVIWNPGAAGALALADLGVGGERGMLCVEAAAAAAPIVLAAGAAWRGKQSLTAC
jgi:glucose-6-phosphate 1-epimerase